MSYYEHVPRTKIVELVDGAHRLGQTTLELPAGEEKAPLWDAWADALYERAESIAGDMCAISVSGKILPESYRLTVTWCR